MKLDPNCTEGRKVFMEQCIYCQTVYELEESTSRVPTSCCSIECEKGFIAHDEAIRDYFIKESIKENYEALKRLSET